MATAADVRISAPGSARAYASIGIERDGGTALVSANSRFDFQYEAVTLSNSDSANPTTDSSFD